jgi:hypothetical protein
VVRTSKCLAVWSKLVQDDELNLASHLAAEHECPVAAFDTVQFGQDAREKQLLVTIGVVLYTAARPLAADHGEHRTNGSSWSDIRKVRTHP